VPAFKGVRGPTSDFPGAVCISVNDETLHTIPFSKRKFKSGDIIKIDFGIIYKNFATDHCITIGIGKLTDEEKRLINTAKNCVETAIKKALSGNTVGDISFALQTITELEGFEYVRDYAGHGIGKLEHGGLHIVPSIPSFGMPGTGRELVEGQTICIENQVSLGAADLILDDDDWTLKTVDGSKTAMFEHTVMVGKKKPLILTKLG
jgi:methionyl aminopeptidase